MSAPAQPPPSGVAAILASTTSSSCSTAPSPMRSAVALFDMRGKVAIVTGAARGIGLEIAVAYAEAGAVVHCLDIESKPTAEFEACKAWVAGLPPLHCGQCGAAGQHEHDTQGHAHHGHQGHHERQALHGHKGEAKEELLTEGKGRLEYEACDVTQQHAMWDLVGRIADKEGRIDVCVANAGILRSAEVLDYPGGEFDKLLNVNVSGVLYTAQAAGRQMAARGIKGSIVLIGSMSGSITNPGMHWAAYNTSKAAVIQLARSIACELGPKGIRCNSISPGYVYTDMTKKFLDDKPALAKQWCAQNPLGRLANPDEMRGIALFLGTDASTFCTGSDLIIDGGQTAW